MSDRLISDDQVRIITWISSIDLEDSQKIQRPLSRFLKGFKRVKVNAGPMVCRISPCQQHQYARGVCAKHYAQLKAVSKIVGWAPLANLGLCNTSRLRDILSSSARGKS